VAALPVRAGPDLAYGMMTSGSTGRPKIVLVEHRNVVNLVRGADYVRLGPGQTMLQLAPVAFDASTFEIWGALLTGARLVLAPPGPLTPQELGGVLARHHVSVLWLTSALFHRIVKADVSVLGPVQQLLAGGDVIDPRHVRTALRARPGRRFVNGYGPTETTTFACCHVVTSADDVDDPLPIGRPVPGASVAIVGADGRELAPGSVGELLILGAGVSRGYLNAPQADARRFRQLADSQGRPMRAYRSGDLARMRADGLIEFHGRIDGQVKIRGYRVEPGEVERALTSHPGVGDAVVTGLLAPQGERRLVAYVVTRQPRPTVRQLRAFLASRLPGYLVPSVFVELEEIPVTENGKSDRLGLPEPLWQERDQDLYVPAATTTGPGGARADADPAVLEEVRRIWSEVLGVREVANDADFFDLGGDSLLATHLAALLREQLAVEVPLRTIFEQPSLADFTQAVQQFRGKAPVTTA
jgi:amino acid adenylation domain-containing protein